MKKFMALFAAASFALVMGIGSALAADAPAAAAPAKKILGAFSVKTAEGKDFTEKDIKGKKVTFVIVQTACSSCRFELDEITKDWDEISKLSTIYTVLVDVNSERALEVYKTQGFKPTPLLDPGFKIGSDADLTSTPATMIVNEKGEITFVKTGYRVGQLNQLKEKMK